MKNKIFEISSHNFGEICTPGGWVKTNIIIYDDFTVDIIDYYSEFSGLTEKIKNKKIDQNIFNQIKEIMEHLDEYTKDIDACDGTAWEYKYYKNNEIYKQRKLGYIVSKLLYLDSESNDDIKLYINSPGGEISSGFMILLI